MPDVVRDDIFTSNILSGVFFYNYVEFNLTAGQLSQVVVIQLKYQMQVSELVKYMIVMIMMMMMI